MNIDFLDFEQPIAELEAKIEELRYVTSDSNLNISEEIARLEAKNRELTKSIFSSLKTIQIVKLARHPLRPHTMDYVERIFTEFDELYGDRHFAKGNAIVGGIARLNDMPVMIIGHQKGRSTKENIERNFGMPNPEEYRKSQRLMELAERFRLPVFTFIDTPGAYPGLGAEERNQSEAIARNLFLMSKLRTPIICTVIGEGGSGGGLALGVGDKILMLQYSYYATISPEGCASILWRSQDKVAEAAETMHLTADKLFKLNLIDQIIPEPLGGAHRHYDEIAATLKAAFLDNLALLKQKPLDKLVDDRYKKLMAM
jgi:acetyl-CoA carboxylase carboxyl transferase subunit alpha